MEVIYPGSFDPVTNGHLDIIERCARKFDRVIVSVLINSSKNSMFTVKERIKLLEECVAKYNNVEVDTFSGLLIDYANQKNVSTLIRGLRAVSDFEYEMQMALMNKTLCDNVETMFMMSRSEFAFLSSSLVKEIARFDGDISCLVPKTVEIAIKEKLKGE